MSSHSILNNYWMRLSMISRIIQTSVNVTCRSEAEADNIDWGLNNSWCHAKAESNNCFIIHLNTSETYKTIKRCLLMFQVYHCEPFRLFYFRALLNLSCWPRWSLGTTASNNFFGCNFDPKKLLSDAEHVSSWNYVISTFLLLEPFYCIENYTSESISSADKFFFHSWS
jgi:hypothetical protein